MKFLNKNNVHKVFTISLILKGFNSLLEIIGGFLFLFTGGITAILTFFIKNELLEDPKDFFANQIGQLLPYLSSHAQLFGAFYLFSHGIIKIFLVVNLLRKKLWAYPSTIVVLFLFIFYQIYRLSYEYSTFLVLLTLFDSMIIYLTWHEYNIMKNHPHFTEQKTA